MDGGKWSIEDVFPVVFLLGTIDTAVLQKEDNSR